MSRTTLSEQAKITLRYWAPGPFAVEHCGDDPEAHEAAGYDGLTECWDVGLLRSSGRGGETYTLTAKGHKVLSSLDRALEQPAVAGGRCPRCGAAAYGTQTQRCDHL